MKTKLQNRKYYQIVKTRTTLPQCRQRAKWTDDCPPITAMAPIPIHHHRPALHLTIQTPPNLVDRTTKKRNTSNHSFVHNVIGPSRKYLLSQNTCMFVDRPVTFAAIASPASVVIVIIFAISTRYMTIYLISVVSVERLPEGWRMKWRRSLKRRPSSPMRTKDIPHYLRVWITATR